MEFNFNFFKNKLSSEWLKGKKTLIIVSAVLLVVVVAFSVFIYSNYSNKYFLSALAGFSSGSNSSIIVVFKNSPNIQNSSVVSRIMGSPKVATNFNSVNNLNKKYNTQSFRQMFAQAQGLANTYELAVNTSNADSTVKDFKNDPNVEYARVSEPGFEQKIKNEVGTINQKIAQQHLSWTAGYTVPEIMTDADRMQLVGAVLPGILSSNKVKAGATANSSAAGCTPNCPGGTCSDDGCGGKCKCLSGQTCDPNQLCVKCTPNCSGKTCGWDGCSGTCGDCTKGQVCDKTNNCCTPNCSGKTCGDDGCGGSCGDCPKNQVCYYKKDNTNTCCTSNCSGKTCGDDDGCGGRCQVPCKSGQVCNPYWNGCCTPNCFGKNCGGDGCGGSCGDCPKSQYCIPTGTCCTPDCSGKICGTDGCDGMCGFCSVGNICNSDGQCVAQRSSLPKAWDWRNANGKNYITPVKNQQSCGSCWAFGAVGAVEGEANAYYNNPSINLDLSEQDIVSCSNAGSCSGGASDEALGYVMSTGVTSESCFPYTSNDNLNDNCSNKCSTWQSNVWKINNYALDYYDSFRGYNNDNAISAIEAKVFQQGPIVTYLTVYNDFWAYTGGIYQPTSTSVVASHAVVIVGYGVDSNNKTYWICKNSWSPSWGEAGFFKIYAGTSGIGELTMSIISPKPPTPQQTICEDKDKDGYCNWGLGPKPSTGCPTCNNTIEDCDDSNPNIGASCIPQPTITVTSPNGGETWQKGTYQIIKWTSANLQSTDKIYVSVINASGNISTTIANGLSYTSKQYVWKIPVASSTIPAGQYKVQVWIIGNQRTISDRSDNYFTITPCAPSWTCTSWGTCASSQQRRTCTDANNCGVTTGKPSETQSCPSSLKVTSPAGGEQWTQGSTQKISWTSSGVDSVKIKFVDQSGTEYDQAVGILASKGSISWTVNTAVSPGNNYRIKIYDQKNSNISSVSNYFSIVSPVTKMTNASPIISSVSGPAAIMSGQLGTWTINATDPENDTLTYRVAWGDSSADPTYYTTNTFTHTFTIGASYQNPTQYQNVFYAKDSSGNEARKDVYVSVSRVGGSNDIQAQLILAQLSSIIDAIARLLRR